MSAEAWIALGGAILTIGTIIFVAGRMMGKMDTLVEAFKLHDAEDKKEFDNIYQRINGHGEDIAALKGNRHPTGGYRRATG